MTASFDRSQRLIEIDCAKGFAIILVVLGHIVRQPPTGAEWYIYLGHKIYLFHMPLFMYLAGFIFGYRFQPIRTAKRLRTFLIDRGTRLLIPFFVFGLLIISLKLAFASHFAIERVPYSFESGLHDLFLATRKSPAQSVWFIFCLFWYQVLAHLAMARSVLGVHLIACAGLILYFVSVTDILYLHLFAEFLLFFAVGAIAGVYCPAWFKFVDRALVVAIPALVVLVWFSAFGLEARLAKLVCGAVAIVAIHGLVRRAWAQWLWLGGIGKLSLPIYLLNTLAVGSTKALILLGVGWNAQNFIWMFPVLFFVGLFGPIVVQLLILRHVPYVRAVMR